MKDADCEEQEASSEGKREVKRRERMVRAAGAVCIWCGRVCACVCDMDKDVA